VDKTGVEIVLTKTLRQHDAGMLVAGDPSLNMDDLPSGQPLVHRQGLCTSACTGQAIPAGANVTIYANFMHMHAFGRQQWSSIYSKDGIFKNTIATVNFWNLYVQWPSMCPSTRACEARANPSVLLARLRIENLAVSSRAFRASPGPSR